MIYNYFNFKGYIKLLVKYILYDLRILVYILLILTAVFFNINFLFQKEVKKNLIEYGGLHEAKTTYNIVFDNEEPQKELKIVLKMLDRYHIQNIKEIWIAFDPLSRVSINYPAENLVSYSDIRGRGFTKKELINGSNVILLSNDDYQIYFSDYNIGEDIVLGGRKFKIIGISPTIPQSIVPFNCLMKDNIKGAFRINDLVLKTEYSITRKGISNIRKEYYRQTGFNPSKGFFEINSRFGDVLVDIFNSMLDYICSIFLLLFFCFLTLVQTCCILYNKNSSHQVIYIYSGGSKDLLKFIIYGEAVVSVIVSFLLSQIILWSVNLWIK